MSPGDVSEKNFGTVLEEGEWSAGIAHARGGAGVVAALLSAGQGLKGVEGVENILNFTWKSQVCRQTALVMHSVSVHWRVEAMTPGLPLMYCE